ncbi:MAG: hypothetical protein FDX21_10165 [Chlorobium sp.]|nr:MAG: hypothetical protein FDX21_10165 [Chlorobium sp.]
MKGDESGNFINHYTPLMMIRILWLQAVRGAWISYIRKMNNCIDSEKIESYLSQKIDMGMTLEEFAEMVFIEGFVAGEKYAKTLMVGNGEHQLN